MGGCGRTALVYVILWKWNILKNAYLGKSIMNISNAFYGQGGETILLKKLISSSHSLSYKCKYYIKFFPLVSSLFFVYQCIYA